MISLKTPRKVATIGMGGTISAVTNAEGGIIPSLSLERLLEKHGIGENLELEPVSLFVKDSSLATPEDWLKLASVIDEKLRDGCTGVVVTHGTDTMEEAVYFIDRTLKHMHPVCFTGAQRHVTHEYPDGPTNLLDALAVATDSEALGYGATFVMKSNIFPAWGLRKISTQNLEGFQCSGSKLLGQVINGRPCWNHRPRRRAPLVVRNPLPRVDLVTEYSGSDGGHLRTSVRGGASAVVVQALGSGNVGEGLFEAILEARKEGIPVIISTRVTDGKVEPLYGGKGGGYSLKKAGCIFAFNYTAAQARIELIVALASGISPDALEGSFTEIQL